MSASSNLPPRFSIQKKIFFCFLLSGLVLGLANALAWLAYRLKYGENLNPAALSRQRMELLQARASSSSELLPAITPEKLFIHPYLGFIFDPEIMHFRPPKHEYPIVEMAEMETGALEGVGPDEAPVLVAGGSVAQVMTYTPAMGAIIGELKGHARFRGKRISILRMAFGGFKQPQQLQGLSWLLALGLKPAAVINLDGFNEVALIPVHNRESGAFPLYPRGWWSLVADFGTPEVQEAIARARGLAARQERLASIMESSKFRDTAFAGLIWRFLNTRWSNLSREILLQAQRVQRQTDHSYRRVGPPFDYSRRSWLDPALRVWANSSLQMAALCKAKGIPYFHFLQPNQYFQGSKPMSAAEKEVAFHENHPYGAGVRAGYPGLVAAGKELQARGVAFTDLTGIFRDHPEPLYVDKCCHFSDEGYDILAKGIVKGISVSAARQGLDKADLH